MKIIVILIFSVILGAALRYLVDRVVSAMREPEAAHGSLIVNVTAAMIAGLIIGLWTHIAMLSTEVRVMLALGMGGFLCVRSIKMLEAKEGAQHSILGSPFLYWSASIIAIIIALLSGMFIVKAVLS